VGVISVSSQCVVHGHADVQVVLYSCACDVFFKCGFNGVGPLVYLRVDCFLEVLFGGSVV
jgi:hypothetical protein